LKPELAGMSEFKSPFYTPEENLEIAIGAVDFRDRVIMNLRQQIKALRCSLINYGMVETSIDNVQYAHLKEENVSKS
jgi:hypothetical protein